MKMISIDDLKIDSYISDSLFDRNGRLILSKGSKFSQKYYDLLKRSSNDVLVAYDGSEGLSSDYLKNQYRPISIENISNGVVIKKPLFNDKGLMLVPKNTVINEKHIDYFIRNFIMVVYEQREESLTTDSLSAGVRDEHIQNVLNNLNKKIEQNILIGEEPTGKPFFEQLKKPPIFVRRDPAIIEKEKENYSNNMSQTQELFSHLQHGKSLPSTMVGVIVEDFLNGTIEDQPLLLSLLNNKNHENDYLYQHSINVAIICINVAASMGFSEEQIVELATSALFSDIGMTQVPKCLIDQNRVLSKEEKTEIQNHVIHSVNMMEKITGITERIKIITYQSHERYNGSGYPKKRQNHVINEYSKILTMADCYDALTSKRPYREAMLPYEAMGEMLKLTSKGFFDPNIMKAFLKTFSLFPIGSYVKLFDDRVAQVLAVNPDCITKPVVSVLFDQFGNLLSDPHPLDLKKFTKINKPVKSVIHPDTINI